MRPNRKRSNALVRWFKKNIAYIFLLGLILVSMFLGGFIYSLFDKDKPVENTSSTETPVIETKTPIEPITELQSEEIYYFYYNVPLSHELQDFIRFYCTEYEVSMDLVIALVDVESSFRPSVISKTNDYGYMQLNKCNHEDLTAELGITDFLDPYQNLQGGIYLIGKHLKATNGDIIKALMRYHNGPTGAWNLWEKGIQTTDYTQKVMLRYERYKKESRSDAGTS